MPQREGYAPEGEMSPRWGDGRRYQMLFQNAIKKYNLNSQQLVNNQAVNLQIQSRTQCDRTNRGFFGKKPGFSVPRTDRDR